MQLILGGGEVGKGLYDAMCHSDIFAIQDVDPYKSIGIIQEPITVLHICIPGTLPEFKSVVRGYIGLYKPELTIIHSTVLPGTTHEIYTAVGGKVVHSPIRGKHPNLGSHIATYIKHIGYIDIKDAIYAEKIFDKAGIGVFKVLNPKTTELGKILELMRYGLEIARADMEKKICDIFNTKYYDTVKEFQQTYNWGVEQVGNPEYRQTIIDPPTGPIGGHCVVQNTKFLKDFMDGFEPSEFRKIANLILDCKKE